MIVFIADKTLKISKLALNFTEDLSYSALMKLLRTKQVKVNGVRIKDDLTLNIGDKVEIYYTAKPVEKFSVVYSDNDITVINKKNGYTSESVFEDLSRENPNVKFIHRLDRNTSGLMVFALNETAEKELLKGFKERTFEKYYTAEVIGVPDKKQDILTAYLIKDEKLSTVKIFDREVKGSVEIKTGYEVKETRKETSILTVTLYTGKTHQIRAHLARVGHPIVGDGKYGDNAFNKKVGAKEQRLSATKLVLHFDRNSPLHGLNGKKFEI